jgi:Mg2+-importing ATPase
MIPTIIMTPQRTMTAQVLRSFFGDRRLERCGCVRQGLARCRCQSSESLFQTGWFVEGLPTQTLIVHLIRTEKVPFIQSTATLPPLLLLSGAIMAIGIAIPFSPLGQHIGFVPPPMAYFLWLAVTLLRYCVLTQLVKGWYIRRYRNWL